MNRPIPIISPRLCAMVATALLALLPCQLEAADQSGPRIDHIETLDPDLVTIHFDTDADRGYELEFQDLATGVGGAQNSEWQLLFSAPAIPFANHYVVADSRSAGGRIYRLRVTP